MKTTIHNYRLKVAPHAGAWIETAFRMIVVQRLVVAPHAGAWIETLHYGVEWQQGDVAPHAGAWIETALIQGGFPVKYVAPHAGAWIETVLHFEGAFAPRVAPHAGAWIETDKTYEFAIFDLELTEFFGEPAVQFSLQTLVDGEVRQQSYFAEWLLKNGSCSRRDSNLKMNQADDLSRLFETDDMPSSMPLLDKIPFNLIHDALDDIMEREDRLIVWKDASDMIDLADKIETAKNFAGLHKNKIFGLVAYSDDEVVPDSVYLEIWDYIWRTLNTDDIYLGAEPYIELSQHETKSGHTEIFNVSADDITYLLDYDRLGLKEFTVKAFLDNFDYEADDILINPDTGSEDTAENWAADFVSHWGDMAYLPSMFFSLDLKD